MPSWASSVSSSASRPSRAPPPRSLRKKPQPPIIRVALPCRDMKTEPVPRMAMAPSCSPSAPCSAISASETMWHSANGSFAFSRSPTPGMLAPASPSTAPAEPASAGSHPASAKASRVASRMLASAPSMSVTMLDGPLRPRPRTRPSAVASAARQLLPPPSMPSRRSMRSASRFPSSSSRTGRDGGQTGGRGRKKAQSTKRSGLAAAIFGSDFRTSDRCSRMAASAASGSWAASAS